MNEQARRLAVLESLKELYPDPKPALNYHSPFQLLIATILSAQCTDARVNIVTESLFVKYRSPRDFISVPVLELEKDIFSTGFYRQKAKSIIACCHELESRFGGEVPSDFDELVKLPGVGRKTASVIAGNAFGVPAIAVDTHVKRLSNLLGFIISNDPDKIESALKEIFPPEEWVGLSHRLAAHGRTICIANRPKCGVCSIAVHCPSAVLIDTHSPKPIKKPKKGK